eukprot:SAG22_NODE_7674_length_718_cov_1.127625_2_plen_128_part_01
MYMCRYTSNCKHATHVPPQLGSARDARTLCTAQPRLHRRAGVRFRALLRVVAGLGGLGDGDRGEAAAGLRRPLPAGDRPRLGAFGLVAGAFGMFTLSWRPSPSCSGTSNSKKAPADDSIVTVSPAFLF